jgi:exodeoxyribonuclease III
MSDSEVRVVSWNVENLAHYLGDEPRHTALAHVAEAFGSPDVLCLQELRIRPSDHALVEQAANALPGYLFVHSLANDPINAGFRGGRTYGVGTYVKRSLNARLSPSEVWDREGRLAAIELPALRLGVVNVYAVNGTQKAHWDHELGRYEGDRHRYKRRFHEHIAEVVRALRARGLDALVIGDFNVSQERIDITPRLRTEEPHAGSRAHFAETVVRGLELVDAFRELHPDARAYTWFARRTPRGRLDAARVDFALISRDRFADVLDASIDEEPTHRFGSDHAPLSVTLLLE